MKRLLYIGIVVSILFACSKRNNPAPIKSISIVGKWYLAYETGILYNYNGTVISKYLINQQVIQDFYQFNNDSSGLHGFGINNGSAIVIGTENFNYKVNSNNQITLNYPPQVFNGSNEFATTQQGEIGIHSVDSLSIKFITTKGSDTLLTTFVDVIHLSTTPAN